MLEELQKKHLQEIVQFIEQGHAGNIAGKKEAATACTTITLQTVVEVLEETRQMFIDYGMVNSSQHIENKITEYTNLLNQSQK